MTGGVSTFGGRAMGGEPPGLGTTFTAADAAMFFGREPRFRSLRTTMPMASISSKTANSMRLRCLRSRAPLRADGSILDRRGSGIKIAFEDSDCLQYAPDKAENARESAGACLLVRHVTICCVSSHSAVFSLGRTLVA